MLSKYGRCRKIFNDTHDIYFERLIKPNFGDTKSYFSACKEYNKSLDEKDFHIVNESTLDDYFNRYGNYFLTARIPSFYEEELCLLKTNKKYWKVVDNNRYYFIEVPDVKALVLAPCAAVLLVGAIVGGIFIGKALNAPGDSFVDRCNAKLATQEAFETMHDLKTYLDSQNLRIEQNRKEAGNDVIWDMSVNRLASVNSNGELVKKDQSVTYSTNKTDYWIVTDDYQNVINGPYSIYLLGDNQAGDISNINFGVDVGNNLKISSINYVNEDASQEVTFRTNSIYTNLTINGTSDTAYHFGEAGEVHVIAVANESYHEAGEVTYLQINKGHLKIEENAVVDLVFANPGSYNDDAFVPADISTISIENKGDVDHAHVSGGAENASAISTTDITFDYNSNEAQNSNTDVYHHVDDTTGIDPSDEKITDPDYDADAEGKYAIEEKIDEEKQDDPSYDEEKTVLLTNGVSNSSELMSFATFRDRANSSADGLTGYTATLQDDIFLKGEAWTPINKFCGVLDGNNKTISSYVINPDNNKRGLINVAQGDTTNVCSDATTIYSEDSGLDENAIAESKYTCVIKNLTIKDATVNNAEYKYHSALVGEAIGVYFDNVKITGKTLVKAYKYSGAMVGTSYASIFKNCEIGPLVKVVGEAIGNNTGGHAAGFVGEGASNNLPLIFADCVNKATISAVYGYAGGFVANFLNKSALFYNCVNEGKISNIYTMTGGIVGCAANSNNCHMVFANSVNKGDINTDNKNATSTNADIGGIIGYGGNIAFDFYNCINSGNITASTVGNTKDRVGGIAGYVDQGLNVKFFGCSNTGTLKWKYNGADKEANPIADGYYQLQVGGNIPTTMTMSQLHDAFNGFSKGTIIVKNVTISDLNTNGKLTLPSGCSSFISNNNICKEISCENYTDTYCTIDVPGEYKLSNTTATTSFTLKGDGAKVTVDSGATAATITLSNNITLINNGTLKHVSFAATNKTYTLNNYGTISTTTDAGNQHTISSIVACNITVNNYGTVESKVATDGAQGSYAFLFYNGSTVKVNFYATSVVNCKNIIACSTAQSVIFDYYDASGNLIKEEIKK